jgi:hypothetical protein
LVSVDGSEPVTAKSTLTFVSSSDCSLDTAAVLAGGSNVILWVAGAEPLS